MTTLKKSIKFLPLAVLGLCLAACGGDEPTNPEQPETPKTVKSVDVMYLFEVSDDMLRVADIDASWTNPDGTKENAKIANKKSEITISYSSFPATATISMKLSPKTPASADDETFNLSASCAWYAYQVTYSDGTKNRVTSNSHSSSSVTVPGKELTRYINERLNPRLADISYSITLTDSYTDVKILKLSN